VIFVRENKNQISIQETKYNLFWDFIPLPFLIGVLIYCGLLYGLSSISSFSVPSPFSFFDKIVHFFLFAGLSAVVALGLYQARHRYSPKMLFFIPVSFSMLYGLTDEIHQLTVPHRIFSAADLAANAVGASAAAAILLFLHQWKKYRQ